MVFNWSILFTHIVRAGRAVPTKTDDPVLVLGRHGGGEDELAVLQHQRRVLRRQSIQVYRTFAWILAWAKYL